MQYNSLPEGEHQKHNVNAPDWQVYTVGMFENVHST